MMMLHQTSTMQIQIDMPQGSIEALLEDPLRLHYLFSPLSPQLTTILSTDLPRQWPAWLPGLLPRKLEESIVIWPISWLASHFHAVQEQPVAVPDA